MWITGFCTPPAGRASCGTLSYMAPELFKGQALGVRGEVYSLGLLMFEMLSGRLPFDQGPPESLVAFHKSRQHAPALNALRPDVPKRMAAAVSKAISADPRVPLHYCGGFRHRGLAGPQSVEVRAAIVTPTQPRPSLTSTDKTLTVEKSLRTNKAQRSSPPKLKTWPWAHHEIRWFCPGSSTARSSPAPRAVSRYDSDMANVFETRVTEGAVAQVLQLISTIPNKREVRQVGDLEGDYDYWFDGGACKVYTGSMEFVFHDDTIARVAAPIPSLSLHIRFREGACQVIRNIARESGSA